MNLRISIAEGLQGVSREAWNALQGTANPFLRHEFLSALERHEAVGPRFGWLPQYLLAHAGERLVGALPMYAKYNSYGEFVFDWAWADAYERHGLRYYPKLVVAVPYTPVTGARILLAADAPEALREHLIDAALAHARELGVSSLHWLFTLPEEARTLAQRDLLRRDDLQFHWENRGYRDFEDFLATFSAKKRKNVRQERRRVREQGIEFQVLHGGEIDAEQWRIYHDFYQDTFLRLGGVPTLSRGFFEELGRSMPENVVLVLARHRGRDVAAAFSLRGPDTLYGRHWGCSEDFDALHFEACYYQGLDYCIRHGLQRFEPGAQGEHKVSRGFLPVRTRSAHWIAHAGFRSAIADFVERERSSLDYYETELRGHSPYKAVAAARARGDDDGEHG